MPAAYAGHWLLTQRFYGLRIAYAASELRLLTEPGRAA